MARHPRRLVSRLAAILPFQARPLASLVLVLAFTIVFLTPLAASQYALAAGPASQSLTILFTHDLHDHLLPASAMINDQPVEAGGFARLKTAINQEKARSPGALLLDAGDFSMGTPFQAIFSSSAPTLRIMGAMGYDAITLGNHEFDYRDAGLAASLEAALLGGGRLPLITQANYQIPDKLKARGQYSLDDQSIDNLEKLHQALQDYGIQPYLVLERNGLKIGIFGLMGKAAVAHTTASNLQFADAVTTARQVVDHLRIEEKVDLVICLSHSGTNADPLQSSDEILARQVYGIDVIISGHSHTTLTQPIQVGQTLIGSAYAYGYNLGVLSLQRTAGSNWQLQDYRLVPINAGLAEDDAVATLVSQARQQVQEVYFNQYDLQLDQVLAVSPFDFQPINERYSIHGEYNLGNLVSDAYIAAVRQAEGPAYEPVSAAIVPAGSIRATLKKGPITTANAYNVIISGYRPGQLSGYPLVSIYLTGRELKRVCELDASGFTAEPSTQLSMSGLNFTWNPRRLILNKVIAIKLAQPDGTFQKLEDTRLYRVVLGLLSAESMMAVGDRTFGFLSVVPKDQHGLPITDFENQVIRTSINGQTMELKEWYAIAQYLKSLPPVQGTAQVPARYALPQGRKNRVEDPDLWAYFSNPNSFALMVFSVAGILILVVVISILTLVRRFRMSCRQDRFRL
jgi:5'-nucleotidase/UDP-sugar diphosphatase